MKKVRSSAARSVSKGHAGSHAPQRRRGAPFAFAPALFLTLLLTLFLTLGLASVPGLGALFLSPAKAQTLVATLTPTVSPTPVSGEIPTVSSTEPVTATVTASPSPSATPAAATSASSGKGTPKSAIATVTASADVPSVSGDKPKAPTPTPRPSATVAPPLSQPPLQPATEPSPTRRATQPTALPHAAKVVYLTFDDGPGEWTQPILDLLAEYDARATFFVLGVQAAEWPDLIEEMYEAGHGIANHTWKHVDLATVSKRYFSDEIEDTADAIGDDYEAKCLRPPYGSRNQTVYDYAEDLGYEIALWSIDPQDWRQPGAEAIARSVLNLLHNRAVILLHDGGGDRSQTVAALRILLPRLQDLGYEMRAVCRDDPMPQVGDYLVGIPSELDLYTTAEETPAAIAAAPAKTAGASAAFPATDNPAVAGDELVGDSIGFAPTPAPDAEPTRETPAGDSGAITFPQPQATVRGRVLIQGFVNSLAEGGTIVAWRLDLLDAETAVELGGGAPTDRVGALGIWDSRTVENGAHTLRLEMIHADGAIEQEIVEVKVRN